MAKKLAFNMYEAKTKLSEIVERVKAGQEVTLMNRGEPVALVIPYPTKPSSRQLGFLKGKIKLKPGWDKPIEDFGPYQK